MDRIPLHALTDPSNSSVHNLWTTVNRRLMCPRIACAAAAVQNRFIVVMGGWNAHDRALSSVEIVDTTNYNRHTTVPGPRMNLCRAGFGIATLGDQLWAIGGRTSPIDNAGFHGFHTSHSGNVEFLNLACLNEATSTDSVHSLFAQLSWRERSDLTLLHERAHHAATSVGGCCLMVAGGSCSRSDRNNTRTAFNRAVEVLDPQNGLVWSLPCNDAWLEGQGLTMISFPSRTSIVVSSGVSIRALALVKLSLPDLEARILELNNFCRLLLPQLNPPPGRGRRTREPNQRQKWYDKLCARRAALEKKRNTLLFFYLCNKQGFIVLAGR
ncbi:hypothetical protein ACA910_009883 [Epithemia clementina (nom. ined.)]